jgi:transposase-like protein
VHQIAKITPADYPELLAAADAGTPQRELARRYDCAPSLVARHLARARREREREPGEPAGAADRVEKAEPHNRSVREILEERIRDPRTAARDLASLTNALARLEAKEQGAGQPSIYTLRPGTLMLEPESGPGPELSYRLMMRVRGGIEHFADGLTNRQVWALAACGLGLVTREELGVSTEPEQ